MPLWRALFLSGWLIASCAWAEEPVLRVGTNPAGAPWSFHDADAGTERGVAVELIEAVAAADGAKVELVPLTLPELIPALQAGRVDVIAANLLVTPERAALVDFSDAIAAGGDGLVVPSGDGRAYAGVDDLKGLRVATQAGPFAERLKASGMFPDLAVFPTGTEAMRHVGRDADVAVVGVNGAGYEIKLGHFPELRRVATYRPMLASVDAFSVRKGDSERLARLNAGLARLRADGTLKRILEKYGQ